MSANPRAKAIICGVFLLCAAPAAAQPSPASPGSRKPDRVQGGVSLIGAVPMGDFAAHVDSAAGLLIGLDTGLGNNVFSVGGEFGYLGYGSESRDVSLASLIPEVPNAKVTVNTDNTMLLLHARARVQRPRGRWRPYADGLLGMTALITETSVEGADGCSGSNCTYSDAGSATNSSDTALSYGAGAGVMIGLGSSQALKLDLSVRYIRGGEAQYLTQGAIHREAGRAIMDFSRSRTDMLGIYVGIAGGR